MSRRRKAAHRDLPKYLYVRKGSYYVVHPQTHTWYALRTNEKDLALSRYNAVMQAWGITKVDPTFQVTDVRGRSLRVVLEECMANIDSMRTTQDRRPLAENTKKMYLTCSRALLNGNSEILDKPFPISPSDIRQILSPWIDAPGRRNNIRSILVRVMDDEVEAGRMETNPVRDVRRRPGAVRDVYMPDDHFWIIHDSLPTEVHQDIMMIMYLLSQRPVDIFQLRYTDAVKAMNNPSEVEGETFYTLSFTQQKTRTAMAIDFHESDQIAEILKRGMERYKRYKPPCKELFFHMRLQRPIHAYTFGSAFRDAVRENGLPTYTPRDLRAKGLTDEELKTGNTANRVNKGGHKTKAMSDRYVKIKLPVRAQNYLSIVRVGQEEGEAA